MVAGITQLGSRTPAIFRPIEAEVVEDTALVGRSMRLLGRQARLTREEVRGLGEIGIGSKVDFLG